MLTSLDFLNIGQEFPPKCEHKRLEMCRKNRQLFESEHAEVYAQDLKRIERVIGNFQDVVSYPVVLNFQKLMSLKIADLLLGEPPQITCGEPDSKEQGTIKKIMESSDLNNTNYQAAIDVSRYGDGLLLIRRTDKGGIIDITQPSIWFPVVSKDNVREIVNHVLAWTYEDKEKRYLKAQIHYIGYYIERLYLLSRDTIASQIGEDVNIKTGLDGFAIVQIPNVITSDRVTGIDDYTDVDSIISELIVRVGQVARILDKHADPSMSGPASALERDAVTGEWRLKMGSYFTRDSAEDPDVKYITWDGQLTASFTQIEKLTNILYTISEMGSALFGDLTSSTGQVPSGSALKRLMISPLSKVNRIRMRFDPAIKQAIYLCSQLDGYSKLDKSQINIIWKDGLPSDEKELAEIMNIRTGQKATISQSSAIKRMDDVSETEAENELAKIQDDEATIATTPPFSTGEESEEPTEETSEV